MLDPLEQKDMFTRLRWNVLARPTAGHDFLGPNDTCVACVPVAKGRHVSSPSTPRLLLQRSLRIPSLHSNLWSGSRSGTITLRTQNCCCQPSKIRPAQLCQKYATDHHRQSGGLQIRKQEAAVIQTRLASATHEREMFETSRERAQTSASSL